MANMRHMRRTPTKEKTRFGGFSNYTLTTEVPCLPTGRERRSTGTAVL